ncbi:M50 family metallopeptidase, partial [Candidatus Woesearchaeota archaeon]|nr:M50 family metallopeptidase [Candidatus Woesearchaeota archaeon]
FFFEVVDMVIMSLAIGYIFSGYLKKPVIDNYDPLKSFKSNNWENVKFGAIVAGLAVVFHELSHKFVAMFFGAKAVLFAPYGFYILVILLKMVGFPFLFFVGGFVTHTGLSAFPAALVAFAGPLMNFILWGAATLAVKKGLIQRKYFAYAVPFAKINLFLGIFNMIPIPGFDGGNFLFNMVSVIF